VDLIDSRPSNTSLIVRKNLSDDLTDLRTSIREHMEKAGIVQSKVDLVTAPASVEQIETILNTAKKEGTDAVLFFRLNNVFIHSQIADSVSVTEAIGIALAPVGGIGLLPFILVFSIPANEEGAHVIVEAIIICPERHVLLRHFIEREDYESKASMWSLSPSAKLSDVTKKAIQKAVVAIADSAKARFPGHTKKADIKTILAPAKTIQRQYNSIQSGYDFTADNADAEGKIRI